MGDIPKLISDPTRRFKCVCGAKMIDGGEAIEHTMHGHQVGIEVFRNGAWRYELGADMHTVSQMMIERLRQKGENIPAFVRRVQEMAEDAKQRAEAHAARNNN